MYAKVHHRLSTIDMDRNSKEIAIPFFTRMRIYPIVLHGVYVRITCVVLQWEYQVGPEGGVEFGDQVWISRSASVM